jgi:hypothetical protein
MLLRILIVVLLAGALLAFAAFRGLRPAQASIPYDRLAGSVGVETERVTAYSISADGRWVAFIRGIGPPRLNEWYGWKDVAVLDLENGRVLDPIATAEDAKWAEELHVGLWGVCWSAGSGDLNALFDPSSYATWSPATPSKPWVRGTGQAPCELPDPQSFLMDRAKRRTMGGFDVDWRGSAVVIRDAASGRTIAHHKPSLLLRSQVVTMDWAGISPDGSLLAYATGSMFMTIAGSTSLHIAWSGERSGSRQLLPHVFGFRWVPNGDLLALVRRPRSQAQSDPLIFVRFRAADLAALRTGAHGR